MVSHFRLGKLGASCLYVRADDVYVTCIPLATLIVTLVPVSEFMSRYPTVDKHTDGRSLHTAYMACAKSTGAPLETVIYLENLTLGGNISHELPA